MCSKSQTYNGTLLKYDDCSVLHCTTFVIKNYCLFNVKILNISNSLGHIFLIFAVLLVTFP